MKDLVNKWSPLLDRRSDKVTAIIIESKSSIKEDAGGGAPASNVSGGTGLSSASVQTNAPNTTNLEGYSLPFKKRKNHVGLKVKGDVFRRLANEDFGPRSEPSPATSLEGGNGQAKTLDDETESTKESINNLISKGERILLECEGSNDVLFITEALYDGKFEISRRAATHKTGVENRGAIALSTPKSTTKKRQLTKYSTSNTINTR